LQKPGRSIERVHVRWLTAFLDFPTVPLGSFERGCSFWQTVTGSTLSLPRGRSDEFATLLPPTGDGYLRVQRTGAPDARCHLDLHVDDVETSVHEAMDLGASGTGPPPNLGLSSPGGLPFCVVGYGGEADRPLPAAWPGGRHSLVDQLCLDISPQAYERERAFWSALTGWERRPGSRPEFEYLVRPPGMPLRLLLQRLDDNRPAPCRAHLDLACDDVPAERARHQALGAVVVREMPNWTTLFDPTGLLYCVTRRNPATGTLQADLSGAYSVGHHF
jgi:predicted enzyme related to lactoylglutathione lyase